MYREGHHAVTASTIIIMHVSRCAASEQLRLLTLVHPSWIGLSPSGGQQPLRPRVPTTVPTFEPPPSYTSSQKGGKRRLDRHVVHATSAEKCKAGHCVCELRYAIGRTASLRRESEYLISLNCTIVQRYPERTLQFQQCQMNVSAPPAMTRLFVFKQNSNASRACSLRNFGFTAPADSRCTYIACTLSRPTL